MAWDASLLVEEGAPKSGWDPSLLVEEEPAQPLKPDTVRAWREAFAGSGPIDPTLNPEVEFNREQQSALRNRLATENLPAAKELAFKTMIPAAFPEVNAKTVQDAADVLRSMATARSQEELQEKLAEPSTSPSDLAGTVAGTLNVVRGVPEFLTSPVGAATLVLGPELGAAAKLGSIPAAIGSRAIPAAFTADMIANQAEAARRAGEASVTGSSQERTEAYGGLGLNTLFAPALARETVKPVVRTGVEPQDQPITLERTPDASQVRQAAEAVKEVPQEAPAQISNERVPSPARSAVQGEVLLTPKIETPGPVSGAEAAPMPILVNAQRRQNSIRLEFDTAHGPITAEQIKQMLSGPDRSVEVIAFEPNEFSTAQGRANFEAIIGTPEGPYSSALAKKTYQEAFGTSEDIKGKSTIENALPFEQRFTASLRKAAERESGAATGSLSQVFSAKGSTDVLYNKIFTALEQGKDVVSGVNEPLIPKAKPFFDAGLIKSGSDLKALVQSGEINKPPTGSVGPGAASPKEFLQRERREPTGSTPVGLPSEAKPNIEVARANKDYNLFNNINSSQWAFYFGKLGQSAKSAIERIFTGEFRMRESINKDTRVYVERTLNSLPSQLKKQGGKAFFDVVNGKRMEDIRSEWEGKPGGDRVIAATEQLKTRLEEVRTTIRDTKRESYNSYLNSLDEAALGDLFAKNMGEGVDASRFTKSQKADALTLSSLPDDWGIADGTYLPHLFFGGYKVTAGDGAFITRAKTLAEAKAKIYQLTKNNPELAKSAFKVEQDTIVPADMIRLGDKNFWRMVGQMKESLGVSAAEVKEAQSGIIGRKASKQKWFGSLQERQGFEGYSKDFKQVMTAYLNGFHRWKELSAMQRDVQPLIETVRSEGRPNAANRLDEIMENLWGKSAKSTVEFDAFVRQIPGVRDWIKPLALDRWSRNVRSLVSLLTLTTVRRAVVNRLQPLQGLYPLVGERLFAKGKILQHTAEGKALLEEGGVRFDTGQYSEPGAKTKLSEFQEKISGEIGNQEQAFLSMFLHGQEQGMGRAEAIQYAKLRGQLMTQFTPLISDIPKALSGPFGQLAFQFKRFPIKQAELAAQLVRERNFGGITRMLGVFAVMGGASFYMRQLMLDKEKQLKMRRALESELGKKGADVAMYGLPGLVGADLSGSLVLGDEPFGENIYEKAGRQIAGPAVSLAYETGKNIFKTARQPMTGMEKTKAIIRRIPSLKPLAELADLESGNTDVMTPDGEVKYRRALGDAVAGLGSFRSANEANKQLAINGILELKKETQGLKNDVFMALNTDPSKALDAVKAFNTRWPEAAITADELTGYLKRRQTGSVKTDEERTAGRKFRPLLESK